MIGVELSTGSLAQWLIGVLAMEMVFRGARVALGWSADLFRAPLSLEYGEEPLLGR